MFLFGVCCLACVVCCFLFVWCVLCVVCCLLFVVCLVFVVSCCVLTFSVLVVRTLVTGVMPSRPGQQEDPRRYYFDLFSQFGDVRELIFMQFQARGHALSPSQFKPVWNKRYFVLFSYPDSAARAIAADTDLRLYMTWTADGKPSH